MKVITDEGAGPVIVGLQCAKDNQIAIAICAFICGRVWSDIYAPINICIKCLASPLSTDHLLMATCHHRSLSYPQCHMSARGLHSDQTVTRYHDSTI